MSGEERTLVAGSDPDCGDNANSKDRIEKLTGRVSQKTFDRWYRERTFARNIRQGQPYFNGPSKIKPPRHHSPSSLFQCHRKTTYKNRNAPEEKEDPRGIFWTGTKFEEDLALPFLQDAVAGENEYVTNSLWVDFTVDSEVGELRIKGETDPVIVTSDCEPLLVTEIKTKRSVEGTRSPTNHHKAQVHAYMKGLSEKYDRTVTKAVLVYVGRTSLNVKSFTVDFDPWFWRETIIGWAAEQTSYRLREKLPPAVPQFEWECNFCSYKQRCGKGNQDHTDEKPIGLLPGLTDYPEEKVAEYLQSHEEAKLTPTLAYEYSNLAEQHGVYDWFCSECANSFDWDSNKLSDNLEQPPQCPICADDGVQNRLLGPDPDIQQEIQNNDHDE
jgi:CRISPR/Cas system-associated exonuclease Cas4 (RecB family)